MFDFAEAVKEMSAAEILNYYRNLYYAEPQVTERGIIANAINDYLTADAQETKHAKWKIIGSYNVECTNCHHVRDIKTQCGWNFCPNCGAKIDLED